LKAIKNENKELKKAILELRSSLNEAYITNVNLGKITKLFLENATSQEEKADIVNRFTNEAKTIEQSNALYESIDKQLKKKQQINLNESSATANGTKELNEQKIYKSNDLLKTIDLMGRVLNC
jgi:chromosome segregation ATPase